MAVTRLGVLGGTFNPIHLGHLHVARSVRRLFDLDRIYFVVACTPPHKSLENLVPLTHRYAMVTLATAGEPSFVPSLIELEPPVSPFSVNTMEKLARRNDGKGSVMYFIAGGDSLAEVCTWRDSATLLASYSFIFVTRPGSAAVEPASVLPEKALPGVRNLVGLKPFRLRRRIRAEEAHGTNRIFIVDIEAPDISASRIRELVSRGKRIRHLVPAPVHEYLKKTHLYGER